MNNNTLTNEARLRRLIVRIGKLMRRYGYIDGGAGNISARLGPDEILITPSGLGKGYMRPDQLIVIDMDGKKIGPVTDANRDMRASSETAMHLEAYRQRSDVNGVVHAHPPTAVALTLAGISLEQAVVPEVVVVMGLIPTTPYATPASTENSDAIRNVIPYHDVLMLAHHGSLTVGPDVWTAYLLLETLEHYANILYKAHTLGGPRPLLPESIHKLLDVRQRMGLMRDHDEALFKKYFGVSFEPQER